MRGQIPWLGFKQIGIPIDRGAREVGESTYTLKKLLQLAMDGLLALSSAPLLVIPTGGAIIFSCGLMGLFVWFCLKAGMPAGLDNTALLACFTMLTGIQLLGLGMVAVYLARVLDEVRGRPTYIVGELVENGQRLPDENRKLTAESIAASPNARSLSAEILLQAVTNSTAPLPEYRFSQNGSMSDSAPAARVQKEGSTAARSL